MDEELIEVILEEDTNIEIDEAIGWVKGDADGVTHYGLADRTDPDQHPIKSIIGLKEQFDEIKTLKTVYSDKFNVANYYKWGGNVREIGRFVNLTDTSTVDIYDGTKNIFGVTVDGAAFVGGQTEVVIGEDEYGVPKHMHTTDDTYALVATSGLVSVRCSIGIVAGDYVVSGDDGVAIKSTKENDTTHWCGYQVVAVNNANPDAPYASIVLGVQADVADYLERETQTINETIRRLDSDLTATMNTANDAYEKATKTDETNQDMSNTVDEIVGIVNNNKTEVEGAVSMSAQAKAVAEAASMRAEEAESRANNAWVQGENIKADEYSLRVNIDKYSVGEFSQAYRLTWEQANSILEEGMFYAPARTGMGEGYEHTETYPYTNQPEYIKEWNEEEAETHAVYYTTKIEEGDEIETTTYYYFENEEWKESSIMPTYTTTFTSGFLYRWDLVNYGKHKWVTVDRYYRPEEDVNFSGKAVRFVDREPAVEEGDQWGYWYANADTIYDKDDRLTVTYKPYTLYHWDDRILSWVPVATLAGNVNNRIMNATTHTANETSFEIINARGSAATIGARITDTEAAVESIAKWALDEDTYNIAGTKAAADGNEGRLTLYAMNKNGNQKVKGASIELGSGEGDDGSRLVLNANEIRFETDAAIFTDENGQTQISGDYIKTGAISSQSYTQDKEGMKIDLDDECIDSPNFKVDKSGHVISTSANIGGWEVSSDRIEKGGTQLIASDNVKMQSLADENTYSPVRINIGVSTNTIPHVDTYSDTIPRELDESRGKFQVEYNTGCLQISNCSARVVACQDDQVELDVSGTSVKDGIIMIDLLVANLTAQYGDAGYILEISYDEIPPSFCVLDDGSLYAKNAKIEGEVISGEGYIGGWTIDKNTISKGSIGLSSDDNITAPSSVDMGQSSPIRLYTGSLISGAASETRTKYIDIDPSLDIQKTYTIDASSLLSATEQEVYDITRVQCMTKQAVCVYTCEAKSQSIKIEQSFDDQGSVIETTGHGVFDLFEINEIDKTTNPPPTDVIELTVTLYDMGDAANDYQCAYEDGKVIVDIRTQKPTYAQGTVMCDISMSWIEMHDVIIPFYDNNEMEIVVPAHCQTSQRLEVEYDIVVKGRNFHVLEDGSLYARGAKIEGEISATSGTFSGKLQTPSGQIGGLALSGSNLFAPSGELEIDGNMGFIKTHDIDAQLLRTQTLTGKKEGAGRIGFDVMGGTIQNVKAFVESRKEIEPSSKGFAGAGWTPGVTEVTIKTDYTLSEQKTFTLTLNYPGNDFIEDKKETIYLTIPAGKQMASVRCDTRKGFIHLLGKIDISPSKFTQIVSEGDPIILCDGHVVPPQYTQYSLGSNNNPWHEVYAKNNYLLNGEAIDTSDANKKNTIAPIDEKYSTLFDALNPVTFKFNDGESGRLHMGLIAQELKESMDSLGIDSQDLAAYCSWKDDNGEETCGIRYGEFIALNIYETQKLKARVAELETMVQTLVEKLNNGAE